MYKIRFRLSKTGRARYISHLDLMATIQRALLRSDIKLEYSTGFNPHPYISAALPLPVGCESICELVDVELASVGNPEGLGKKINAQLPEGISVLEMYTPVRKFKEITWIEIEGTFHYNKQEDHNTAKALSERFAAKSIIIKKRSKSGVNDVDIAPYIRDIEFSGSEPVNVKAKISAQNPSINPDNLLSALEGEFEKLKPDHSEMKRIEVYDNKMTVFT